VQLGDFPADCGIAITEQIQQVLELSHQPMRGFKEDHGVGQINHFSQQLPAF
jgi:hypothetical protein